MKLIPLHSHLVDCFATLNDFRVFLRLIKPFCFCSDCESTIERLAYVAAFASSVYANVPGR